MLKQLKLFLFSNAALPTNQYIPYLHGNYSFFGSGKCGNFGIMAIFYFKNLIVAMETIEAGNYSRAESMCGNTVIGSI